VKDVHPAATTSKLFPGTAVAPCFEPATIGAACQVGKGSPLRWADARTDQVTFIYMVAQCGEGEGDRGWSALLWAALEKREAHRVSGGAAIHPGPDFPQQRLGRLGPGRSDRCNGSRGVQKATQQGTETETARSYEQARRPEASIKVRPDGSGPAPPSGTEPARDGTPCGRSPCGSCHQPNKHQDGHGVSGSSSGRGLLARADALHSRREPPTQSVRQPIDYMTL
jgi:hypothetical protein